MLKIMLLFAATLCLLSASAMAQGPEGPVTVDTPYAFATASAQKNGAVFLRLTNHTGEDDQLVGASSPLVETAQLHTTSNDNGIMMMREVAGFEISDGETLELEPSSHHIMLLGLQTNLKEGEEFPLTLTLEKYGDLTVNVTVRAAGTVDADIPETTSEDAIEDTEE